MAEEPRKETRRERTRRLIGEFCGHLLTSKTCDEAAAKTGVSTRTTTRWLRSDEFRAIYVEQRQATLQNVAGMLRQTSVGSVEALGAVIKDPESPATARVAASKAVLDTLLRITEVKELEERLRALEALSQERSK